MSTIQKIYNSISGRSFNIIIGVCFSLTLVLTSCESYLESDVPSNYLEDETVFSTDESANAAVNGMYSSMYFNKNTTRYWNTLITGFSSDELSAPPTSFLLTSSGFNDFLSHGLNENRNNLQIATAWNDFYNLIYQSNSIMENLESSTFVSVALNQQLTGEAKFIRAFSHFYLLNYFGEIPLIITTDVNKTANAPRSSVQEVYDQITEDLMDAMELLPEDYTHANGEKTRVNKWAATALLARVYLYQEEWEKAAAMATNVIENGNYSLSTLDNAFLANNIEAIFQLNTSSDGNFGVVAEAGQFIPFSSLSTPTVFLREEMINDFEAGDARLDNWISSYTLPTGDTFYYPYKYKLRTVFDATSANMEYYTLLRLGEQYLIRAEAYAQQGSLEDAIKDINELRSRAGLANYSGIMAKDAILMAVEKERRSELFTEWGHRWFDLKRTGRLDAVMSGVKPDSWLPGSGVFPLPQSAVNTNPNLEN